MNQLLEQAETLQHLLIAQANGGTESEVEYRELRQVFLSDPTLSELLPRYVHTCRSLFQFWQFIKYEYSSYAERRDFIWESFRPMLEYAEYGGRPADESISYSLERLDAAHVHAVWSKALDRRETDPEGAITAARTLLETVCKHILDGAGIIYQDGADLPKLFKATAEVLNLAPSQHTEQVFRQILGGCTSVVEGLGAMRNKLSDAHGKGSLPVRPAPRHAELAVNLAGSMAAFLVETWKARSEIEA